MGVRLYPNTQNPASLEKLAGVPAGTHARLEATEKRHEEELTRVAPEAQDELKYRQWCEKNDDQALGNLDSFLTYGWGKFADAGVATGYSGNLSDPALVRYLLAVNSIAADPDLTEGVHWC